MDSNRSGVLKFFSFLLILTIGLLLNGLLGLSGFESVYKDSLIRQYNVHGEYIKTNIETSLNLGKKLYLLGEQSNKLFYEVLNRANGIKHIYITDVDSNILYSTRTVLTEKTIPFSLQSEDEYSLQQVKNENTTPFSVQFLDSHYISIPLYYKEYIPEGFLLLEFSDENVSTYILKQSRSIIGFGLRLILGFSLAFVFFYQLLKKFSWGTTVVSIVLLLVSQVIFAVGNYNTYNTAISTIFNKNMTVLSKAIAEDIQKPLEFVDSYKELSEVPKYLNKRIAGNPQCADIFIADSKLRVLFSAKDYAEFDNSERANVLLDVKDSDLHLFPLSSDINTNYLVLKTNRPMITSILTEMALDSATIIVVALIFSFILNDLFIFIGSKKRLLDTLPENYDTEQNANAMRLIKVSTFFFMFAAFETLSFIPLLIKDVFRSSPGVFASMNENTVISLPVTSYMLGITISMFMTLFVFKNLVIRMRYIIMTLVFILGSVLTCISHNIAFLIIARFFAGFGFGGVLLSTSSLIMAYTSEKTRSTGFGTNAAAFAAASIASIAVGGVISSKFGYIAGIGVSIVFAVFFLLFSIFCITSGKSHKDEEENVIVVSQAKAVSAKDFVRIMFSKHILSYLACVNIPFQLIYVGLFQFLLPLYMDETLGFSQGNIGRILCIFSIVSLGASWISKFSDKVRNDKLLIAIGAMCVGIVMVCFNLFPSAGILLFFAIMVAMGIDNVFIDAIEEVYVSAGSIEGIDEENLLQSYKSIEKIISVAIPSITTAIIAFSGFSGSMLVVGTYSIIGAIGFLLFGKNGRWKNNGK